MGDLVYVHGLGDLEFPHVEGASWNVYNSMSAWRNVLVLELIGNDTQKVIASVEVKQVERVIPFLWFKLKEDEYYFDESEVLEEARKCAKRGEYEPRLGLWVGEARPVGVVLHWQGGSFLWYT